MPVLLALLVLLLGVTPATAATTTTQEPLPSTDAPVCPNKPRVFQIALYYEDDRAPHDITQHGKRVDAGVVRFYPPPFVMDAFLPPMAAAIEAAGLRSTMVARVEVCEQLSGSITAWAYWMRNTPVVQYEVFE